MDQRLRSEVRLRRDILEIVKNNKIVQYVYKSTRAGGKKFPSTLQHSMTIIVSPFSVKVAMRVV